MFNSRNGEEPTYIRNISVTLPCLTALRAKTVDFSFPRYVGERARIRNCGEAIDGRLGLQLRQLEGTPVCQMTVCLIILPKPPSLIKGSEPVVPTAFAMNRSCKNTPWFCSEGRNTRG